MLRQTSSPFIARVAPVKLLWHLYGATRRSFHHHWAPKAFQASDDQGDSAAVEDAEEM